MALIDGMLQELEQETQTTRRVLERVWYHHRGQLTVYLRELGVPIPSIYGPSADETPSPRNW